MPELADVEVARGRLARWLRGATIVGARSADARILRPDGPRSFVRALVGRSVQTVERRGKWLRIVLSDGGRLFSHLGMTGWWVERPFDAPQERSERARIDAVRDGTRTSVRYLDPRRFGRLVASEGDIPEWLALGPDPLADGIRADRLAAALAGSRRPIKNAMMDQAILAGVGNILATEALFRARIDPRSASSALSRADIRAVVRAVRATVEHELARKVTRERAEKAEPEVGRQNGRRPPGKTKGDESGCDEDASDFAVYGRRGEPCPRCGRPLRRVVLAGRGTTFCEHCQVRRIARR